MAYCDEWWDTEFAQDIHDSMKQRESKLLPLPGTHKIQMRKFVVNCIMRTCDELDLAENAKHLAVSIYDRFAVVNPVMKEDSKILVVCCILLSTKLEEKDEDIPNFDILIDHLELQITKSEYMKMELKVLVALNWNIGIPTAFHFKEFYMNVALGAHDTLRNGQALTSLDEVRHDLEEDVHCFSTKEGAVVDGYDEAYEVEQEGYEAWPLTNLDEVDNLEEDVHSISIKASEVADEAEEEAEADEELLLCAHDTLNNGQSLTNLDEVVDKAEEEAEADEGLPLCANDSLKNGQSLTNLDELMEGVNYFLESSLHLWTVLEFEPSLVMAACFACARFRMGVFPIWSDELRDRSEFSWQQLFPCMIILLTRWIKLDAVMELENIG